MTALFDTTLSESLFALWRGMKSERRNRVVGMKISAEQTQVELFFPNKRESMRERGARNDQKPIDYKNNILFIGSAKHQMSAKVFWCHHNFKRFRVRLKFWFLVPMKNFKIGPTFICSFQNLKSMRYDQILCFIFLTKEL